MAAPTLPLFSYPTPTRRAAAAGTTTTPSATSRSLSDQLRPLSLTILKDKQTTPQDPSPLPPKPIWFNPSKPKPPVLSPHRHPRPPFSLNPDLHPLLLLARQLTLQPPDKINFEEFLPIPPSRSSALLLLNALPHPHTLPFLSYLRTLPDPPDTVFYNVALKHLRHARQYPLAELLAREMMETNVPLDNITYSTLITCAKRCRRPDRAMEWFDHMYTSKVVPDEVTYSAVLDVYASLGKHQEVVALYERARSCGWKPDNVAFSVMAKMYGRTGDYDGIQYVLQEMQRLSVRPNAVLYNTLLEAMGKAGKPGLARSLFEEMVGSGVRPNEKTLTALVKIYSRARWGKDAVELWERMQANKWPMDFILYNTLLSMCAELGMEAEAEELFEDMKGKGERGGARPDSWSYTAMIKTYGNGGRPEKAMEVFGEMMERGVAPNVMGVTCLIQCLGKSGKVRDAVKVFRVAMEKGVVPDDRLSGCLLSIIAICGEDEVDMVVSCLGKANSRLVRFVQMIGKEETSFDEMKDEFKAVLNETALDARRPFCNCLIDICRNRRRIPSQRAHELFQLGIIYGLYPGLHGKNSREWSLNLRSLSVGAANTAVEDWMKSLCSSVEKEEALPQEFVVHAGAGTHRFSLGLANVVGNHLNNLGAPFQPIEEKSGSFIALKEDLVSWVSVAV